ncbi:EAL domain-containing protein [Bacillus sp. 1P06AnD]|uniref:sensor domain-containing protein n=1 Tax=Bacillus sp. 1P06AnD TaxID=3132208 RepID=UPI0039A06D09
MKKQKKETSEPLSNSDEYHILMASLGVSVSKHLLDEHFTVVWANDYYYDMFGYTKREYEETFHNKCSLFFTNNPVEWDSLAATVEETIKNGKKYYEYVGQMPHKSGKMIWVRLIGHFIDEYIDGYQISYSVMSDITEFMNAQTEKMVTYNNIPGFVSKYRITEEGFSEIYANPNFYEFFYKDPAICPHDYSLSELKKMGMDAAKTSAMHKKMRNGESVNYTYQYQDAHNNDIWLKMIGEKIDEINHDPIYLFICSDITEITNQREIQKEMNKQLEQLAFVDPITSGLNYTKFEIEAERLIRKMPSSTYALVLLDVQKFSIVNELFGIDYGDRVIQFIHKIIKANLQGEEMVAHLTADNFILLLKAEAPYSIEARLNDIANAVNCMKSDSENSSKQALSMKAGIYVIDNPTLPLISIRDRTNTAMKNTSILSEGKLCVCHFYNEENRNKLIREKEMEARRLKALDEEEFVVFLQPKICLKNKRVVGAEALVRWQDPELGMIAPNEFIPFFEKKGAFIIELDLYVFQKVCATLQKWILQGVELIPISFNVSRAHFYEKGFLSRYEEIRKSHHIPPSLLEFEITETLVYSASHILIDAIEQIRSLGYTCSIDDFGSGLSSLNMLKNIFVDSIKLDQAFLSKSSFGKKREEAIITFVISLARELQMTTVAEGVETEKQIEFLKRAGCDHVQGYFFSRPLPIKEFEMYTFGKMMDKPD